MADSADLRVLLLGYGFAGGWIHGPLIEACPGLTVTGVVTGDPERAALARRRHAGTEIFATSADAFARGDVDLVVVATPNASHLDLVLEGLRLGASVVVDKPVAPSLADARRLLAESAGAPGSVSVFHNRRWDGDFATVQQLVTTGALGDVHRFTSRFDRWAPGPSGWRDGPAAEGGGLLLDLGAHLVDQALVLFGPVHSVYAELQTRAPFRESDDDVFVSLEHASGVRSHLFASASEAFNDLRFHVVGSLGGYVKNGKDVQEERLLAGEVPQSGLSGQEPADRWGVLRLADRAEAVPTVAGDWTAFYAAVAAHLRGEGPNPVPLEDALAGLTVIQAAQRSAREGAVVRLGTDE